MSVVGACVLAAIAWSLGLVIAMGLAHPVNRRAAAGIYVVVWFGLPALLVALGTLA